VAGLPVRSELVSGGKLQRNISVEITAASPQDSGRLLKEASFPMRAKSGPRDEDRRKSSSPPFFEIVDFAGG
jgi:hypothetical protein